MNPEQVAIESANTTTKNADTTTVRLPNFFIAGAAKAGTTSLWWYLLQHPEIYMPGDIAYKEPSYFCNLYGVKDLNRYLALFSGVTHEKMIGEASNAYLTSPESPSRIREMIPHAKFIIMLRNPVRRAYSLYNWMVKEGYEPVGSFEEALEAEDSWRYNNPEFKVSNPQYYYNYLYFHSGLYAEQIQRYLDTFPKEQILFLRFEDFVKDVQAHIQRVFAFLGVDQRFVPQLEAQNPGVVPYLASLQFFLKQKLHRYLKHLSSKQQRAIVSTLMRLNTRPGKPPQMKETTRNLLAQRYWDDIQRTSQLTSIDSSDWLRTS